MNNSQKENMGRAQELYVPRTLYTADVYSISLNKNRDHSKSIPLAIGTAKINGSENYSLSLKTPSKMPQRVKKTKNPVANALKINTNFLQMPHSLQKQLNEAFSPVFSSKTPGFTRVSAIYSHH